MKGIEMKKFYAVMCVVVAILVVLNIRTSGVGASTSTPVNNWYQTTGKTQLAQLSADIHSVNKTVASPSGLPFAVACQSLYSDSVAASQLSQVPNKKLEKQWVAIGSALNSAGDNCVHGEVWMHSTGGVQKATVYINDAKLFLVTGNKLLVKFMHQMK